MKKMKMFGAVISILLSGFTQSIQAATVDAELCGKA